MARLKMTYIISISKSSSCPAGISFLFLGRTVFCVVDNIDLEHFSSIFLNFVKMSPIITRCLYSKPPISSQVKTSGVPSIFWRSSACLSSDTTKTIFGLSAHNALYFSMISGLKSPVSALMPEK